MRLRNGKPPVCGTACARVGPRCVDWPPGNACSPCPPMNSLEFGSGSFGFAAWLETLFLRLVVDVERRAGCDTGGFDGPRPAELDLPLEAAKGSV